MKTESATGEQYFVTEASVTRAIAELKQLYALRDMSSHTQADLDTPSHVQPEQPEPEKVDTTGQSQTDSDMSRHDWAGDTRYVEQLETRIKEKDEVIDLLRDQLKTKDHQLASASERDRETNILISGLQNMVLALQAPGATRTTHDVPVGEQGNHEAQT